MNWQVYLTCMCSVNLILGTCFIFLNSYQLIRFYLRTVVLYTFNLAFAGLRQADLPFIYLLDVNTLLLSSDTPEEGIQFHYRIWLLGIELRNSGRSISALNHLAISQSRSPSSQTRLASTGKSTCFCLPSTETAVCQHAQPNIF